jgi:hypothetical protein
MKFDDAAWEQWTTWIDEIKSDLSHVVNAKAIFEGFRGVLEKNEAWITANHGDRFCRFVVRGYVIHVVLGIRRHAKIKRESISLARLLDQMQKCAPQITFDYYMKRFPADPRSFDWQSPMFEKFSANGSTMSEEPIRHDLESLKASADVTEMFVDKALAHLDSKKFDGELTFKEIHEAIEQFDKLTCRYLNFLKGGIGYETLKAAVQYPWMRIFDVPLRRPV